MTHKSVFALSLVAATALGGAAFASGDHGQKPARAGQGNGMMMNQQGGGQGGMGGGMMGGGQGGMGGGMMGGGHGAGQGGGMGAMMKKMMDADGDGRVTPEEARAALTAKLAEFDKDGNGTLSIEEFEALNAAVMRERMVDRFQYLDNDGDGEITSEEMTAPAKRMEHRLKASGQQGNGSGNGAGNGMGMGMNNDADGDETRTDN